MPESCKQLRQLYRSPDGSLLVVFCPECNGYTIQSTNGGVVCHGYQLDIEGVTLIPLEAEEFRAICRLNDSIR